jgi:hypothetical protein
LAEELDIAASVSDIASDLGLGSGDDSTEEGAPPPAEHEDPPAEGDRPPPAEDAPPAEKAPIDKIDDETIAASLKAGQVNGTQPRPAPKAWAKEQHEIWGKLDPKAQAYIEHREQQMLEGLSQYGDRAKFGESIQKALQPYEPYIKANGIDAPRAVSALFEAHKNLAEGTPEQKAAYLVKVAKNYGIDLAKAAAHATGNGAEEPAYVKDLRERQERIEREQSTRTEAEKRANSEKVAAEVTAFAEAKDEKGALKRPYFDECHEDIVAYINAGHTLEKAYEKAVWANPVTRAKEAARQREADEAALRAKAKKEAEAARNGSRTNVNSKDTRRAPTASKTGKWEDTMVDTLAEIKARTH